MTSNLPAEPGQMTKAEAEKLTARINRDGYRLGELLLQAHDGKAWAALGYRSWSAYIASEFTFSRATSYRLLAAEREPDALVQGSECLTTETDDPKESSNGQVVDALDVDQRPLDTITPDAVLPPKRKAPAKSSEGVASSPLASPVKTPSDHPSGGAEVQPTPPQDAPTGGPHPSPSAPPDSTEYPMPGYPVWPDPDEIIEREIGGTVLRGPRKYIDECKVIPLPSGGVKVERPPTDRALTARVYAAMRDIDPTDAGPVSTPEEATFLRQWAQRTLDAWKSVYAPPAPAEKPQRRQGTITRPQAAVLAGRAIEQLNGTAGRPSTRVTIPTIPTPKLAKRHADDCSCLSCKAPKAVAK